jgi:tRNA (cmo5U34)-methyltransferase
LALEAREGAAVIELVGDGILASHGRWSFGGNVCDVFEAHIRRSVPLYDDLHRLIVALACRVVPECGRVIDLGCSTGTLLRALVSRHPIVDVVGVDVEPNMVASAMRLSGGRGTYLCEDIRCVSLGVSHLVTCCYTLQFVPICDRLGILQRIARSLAPGGMFVLAEKVRRRDPALQRLCAAAHDDFKRRQGFSDDEIAAKARSLDGVLTPLFDDENLDMLREAGFGFRELLLRHSCFDAWVARA